MILDNLSRAFKTQNWLAAGVEFVIVIAGVVIGFQINAWAQEQEANARERAILERLLAETEAAVVELVDRVDLAAQAVEDLEYALATLQQGGIEHADTDRLIRGLGATFYFPSTTPPRAVQDELINSGRSAELDSSEVREALGRYNAELSFIAEQLGYFRDGAFYIPNEYPELYRLQYDAESNDRLHRDVNLPAIMANSVIQSRLALALRNQIVFLGYREDVHSAARDLCRTLAVELDTSCATVVEVIERGAMILQNLSRAVREQNYYAVALEFVIVIAGVVIGFQIATIGERAAARDYERDVLTRLYSEISGIQEGRIYQRAWMGEYRDLMLEARSVLFAGRDEATLSAELCFAIAQSHVVVPPPDSLPALDELVASGRMETIQSVEIRNAASDYLQRRDMARLLLEYHHSRRIFLSEQFPALIHYDLDAMADRAPDDNEFQRICYLDAMRENQRFLASVTENIGHYDRFLEFNYDFIDESLTELKSAVAGELGLPPKGFSE